MPQITLDEIKAKAIPVLKKAGVKHSSLFGSYVRGDYTKESDIDVLVELPEYATLLDLISIKQDLEEVLERSVDVVTYKSIYPPLKESILSNQYVIL